MEAQLSEANTFPSESYAQSFFNELPTDNRFLCVSHHKIMPTSSLDGKTITFILDRYDSANIYQIQVFN